MQTSKDVINNQLDQVNKYISSDPRLQQNRSILERLIDPHIFEKLINATMGVRTIHYIDYNGTKIPMRLISLKEEIKIKHDTHIEFKNYPEFIGGEDNPMFSKIELAKILSKSTTSAPETNDAFYSEAEIFELPAVAFNYLLMEYEKLNKEYNLSYNPSIEEDLSILIRALIDGAPINEKKLVLLSGLSFNTLLQITIRFLTALQQLEDNTHFITLLNNLTEPEINE